MTSALRLQLSFSPCVQRLGAAPVALAPRDAALLAWLALEGPTPRNQLAALIWPESPAEAARNSLRQRLFQLKKQLGTAVVDGQALLALAAGVQHDLVDTVDLLGSEPLALGTEFDAWLAVQREDRRSRICQTLTELADGAERAGEWPDALHYARELLALQPLSEGAHQRLMRLHYLAGDRAAALLAFDHCERVLKDEVGARPSAATLALLATLEGAGAAAPALPALALVPASVLRPPRLFGRDAEAAALAVGWAAAHVVALIGEAGMGKTRLLQEFAATRSGVVHVAARPGDTGVPLATLARLLRAVAARPLASALLQAEPATRSEVARVVPELGGGAAAALGEGQRLVLQRALGRVLWAQSALEGVALDDLHFADEASLDMLLALLGDAPDSGEPASAPRWALSWRPAEAGTPLSHFADALADRAALRPVPLQPLGIDDLTALVDSLLLPGVQGGVLAPTLHRRTGGNPLFVLETLKQAWVEGHLQARRTGGETPGALVLPRPASVTRLIERRIRQLSSAALALARVAAIAGVDFGVPLAEHVLQVPALRLADAFTELEAAQVLRGDAFAHDLVYEAVAASVPATIAAHTHAQVATWLEQHGGEAARIAQHWIRAEQGARALPWLEAAAQAAGATARSKEQVAFLELKSSIEEATGDRASAFASQLLAAELLVVFDSSEDRSIAQCDRLDALAVDDDQHLQAKTQRAHLLAMRGERAQAIALARRALSEARYQQVSAASLAICRLNLATSLALFNHTAEAISQFEACAAWMATHGSDEQRCEFHGNLAMTYGQAGRLADSRQHHDQALELAFRLDKLDNITMCLNNAAANRIYSGLLSEGESLLARLGLLATRSEDESSVAGFAGLQRAICNYQQGRYRAALQALDDSADRLGRFAPGFRASVLIHLAVCWWHLGQWGRLQQTMTELGALGPPSNATTIRMAMLQHRMNLAQRRPALITELQAKLAQAAELPELQHMVEFELLAGQDDAAALARLEAIANEARDMGYLGTVIAALSRAGRVAARLGDAPRARQHVADALAQAQRASLVRQYPAELWLHCGEALEAAGDEPGAATLFAQGRDWVLKVARDQVPGEFRAGFLERNPVNQALLAHAARRATQQPS